MLRLNRLIHKVRFKGIPSIGFEWFCVLIIGAYLIVRILIVPYFYEIGKVSDLARNAMDNVADNLIAGLVFAFMVFVSQESVKRFLEPDKRTLTNHFYDIHSLVRILDNSIQRYSRYKSKQGHLFEQAYIVLLSPILITEEYVDYVCGNNDADSVLTKNLLKNINKNLGSISESKRGAFDVTIIGRTNIPAIDTATKKQAMRRFFINDNFPGTTELGYHKNLDEYGIFIFGECDPMDPARITKIHDTIMVMFSGDYKRLQGYACSAEEVGNISYSFHQGKIDDCRKGGSLLSNTASEDWPLDHVVNGKSVAEFKNELESFFTDSR